MPFELSADVIATPVTPSGSSTSSAESALRKLETALPLLVVLSSRIVVKFAVVKELPLPERTEDPAVDKIGASLVALTFITNVFVLVFVAPFAVPPLSCAVTVTVTVPLALAAGVYVKVPLSAIAGCAEKRELLLLLIE